MIARFNFSSLLLALVLSFGFAGSLKATDATFTASINIYQSIIITEVSPLTFPNTEASASIVTVTVAPTDAGAANYTLAGAASQGIQASIVEASITMTDGTTNITVDTFTFGGTLDAVGAATLDGAGSLTGAKIGATATIPASPTQGAYSGTGTFRVVYQ